MKVSIKAPESLSEVTLRKYQSLMSLDDPSTFDFLNIFTGISKSVMDKIPYVETEKLKGMLMEMFNEEQSLVTKFTLNGIRYGFIPDLDKLSFGEHSDLTEYISDDYKQMHRAMAVLYRPITTIRKDKYLIKKYNGTSEYAETMKDMPLSVVFGSIVFFYSLANDLLNYIPSYFQNQEMSLIDSSKNGEGITNLIQSLKEISERMTRLQGSHFINA